MGLVEVKRQLGLLIEGEHDEDDVIHQPSGLYHRQWTAVVVAYNTLLASEEDVLPGAHCHNRDCVFWGVAHEEAEPQIHYWNPTSRVWVCVGCGRTDVY